MSELALICIVTSLLAAGISAVYIATKNNKLKHREEIRVGVIGCAFFLYVSWITIYIANMHPFVKPEFKKSAKPSYLDHNLSKKP